MMKDDENGWWGIPPLDAWTCPECGETSPVADWEEVEAGCEECGTHDGRKCPKCEEIFDHVWGAPKIAKACSAKKEAP